MDCDTHLTKSTQWIWKDLNNARSYGHAVPGRSVSTRFPSSFPQYYVRADPASLLRPGSRCHGSGAVRSIPGISARTSNSKSWVTFHMPSHPDLYSDCFTQVRKPPIHIQNFPWWLKSFYHMSSSLQEWVCWDLTLVFMLEAMWAGVLVIYCCTTTLSGLKQ